MNSNKPLAIAIAAVSGGGKTTITTHLNTIKPICDLIIDGSLPINVIVNQVCETLKSTK